MQKENVMDTANETAIHDLAERISSARFPLPVALEFQMGNGPHRVIRHCRTKADYDDAIIEAHQKNWSLLGPTSRGDHCPTCHSRPCQC
jgi:hypothetical protein